MTFTLIEGRREIAKAQLSLSRTLRKTFDTNRLRNIGYPSATVFDARIHTDENYWFREHKIEDASHPRTLNWFGLMKPTGSLHIAVEVNTPLVGRDDMVAGFFARHVESGEAYLLHSGRVGGGKKGVGRTAFLAWSDRPLERAIDSDGRVRLGIVVTPLDGATAAQSVVSYVDEVAAFKAFVSAGGADNLQFRNRVQAYSDYFDEASGRRTGKRSSRIDYVSRHGDIVRAVRDWRSKTLGPNDGRIVKSVLLDLGVGRSGQLLEAYEIKTSTGRQNLYAAIGQLLVHGGAAECKKYLVCPSDLPIPDDVSRALKTLDISILGVRITSTSVHILG